MNILLLVKNFDYGGAENHVCELANELVSQGHTVHLVSRNGRQTTKLHKLVEHHKIRLSDLSLFWQIPWLVYLILSNRIQIIHAHQRLGIFLGSLLGKLTNIPVVATVHGKIKHDLRSEFVRNTTSKIIVVSENSYHGASRIQNIANKTIRIYNGVKIPTEPIYTFPKNPTFFYGSRLDKRHSQIIEMLITQVMPKLVEHYPDAKLILAGDGNYAPVLKSRIAEINKKLNRNTIEWKGYSSFLMKELKEVSLIMGVGRVAMEGICSGIPVYSLNWQHGGTLITRNNFNELLYSNFVDIEVGQPTPETIIDNINEFIQRIDFYREESHRLWKETTSILNITNATQRTVCVYESLETETAVQITSQPLSVHLKRSYRLTWDTTVSSAKQSNVSAFKIQGNEENTKRHTSA